MRNILSLLLLLFFITLSAEVTLTIHYHRYNADYEGWGLHLWNAVEESGGTFIINGETYDWSNPLPFSNEDSYGVLVDIPILYEDLPLGFIVHKGDEKDPPGLDRSFSDYDITTEIWLLQGIAEIYYEEPSTEIRVMSAIGDGIETIHLTMTGIIEDYETRFQVYKDGNLEEISDINAMENKIDLVLENPIDITILYEVYDTVLDDSTTVLHQFPIDEYVYDGDDLGFTYSSIETVFKLWSPTASSANVLIYETASNPEEEPESYPMTRIDDGVLECTIPGDLKNKYYLYELTMMGQTHSSQDPYSRGISTNSFRSLIFDPEDTNPVDWDEDVAPIIEHPVDAIIYEVHIRDLSINETWNGSEINRGKYLGMVESGTEYQGVSTGFDHILDLGVNCVQILPFYDFGSVDETNPESRNWGYDPMAYNVPEGSYSTNPEDITRILELKSMIKGFHDAGIKVIMDVVYNHTYYNGDGSFFDQVVPKYYYWLDENGEYLNYTGTGNTIDTSKPMVRNFIIQSVKYWVEELHIDGFRFDLMGLIETDLMEEIVDELQLIKPDILVYGEPWGGYGAPILTGKGDQRSKDFGCFNDNIRNAIRGDTDGLNKGYALGNNTHWWNIEKGVLGSITDFTDGPSETLNYLSAHDNYTWWDKIERTVPELNPETMEQMDRFGIAIIMTAQGIAFMHAGSEFLRTKRAPGATEEEIRNSYNANDEVNKLDWARKVENLDTYEYYKGLIALRKTHPEFRLRTAEEINEHLHLWENNPNNTITFMLDDLSLEDDWGEIIVSFNPNEENQYPILPPGNWVVVVDDDEAGNQEITTGISTFSGNEYQSSFMVSPYSAKVLYKESEEYYLYLNVFQNPALNNYLNLTVNVNLEEFENIQLLMNNQVLELEELTDNTWIHNYVMTDTGLHELMLSVDNYTLVRGFNIGSFGPDGGRGESTDGQVIVNFSPGSFEFTKYFVIFDKSMNPTLEYGEYEIGTEEMSLNNTANLAFVSNSSERSIYRKIGTEWIAINSYYEDGYIVAQIENLGIFRLGERTEVVEITKLIGNYPNPFNPETRIEFEISDSDQNNNITLKIYNIKGQLVKNLIDTELMSGTHTYIWKGFDNNGDKVGSGVYLYNLKIGNRSYSRKMLLLK